MNKVILIAVLVKLFYCFRADVPNKTFNFDLQLPVLEFKGDYSIALKLLIKISGTGKFVGSFSEEINFFL